MEISYKANKFLVSASLTLIVFVVLNIFKTAFPSVKAVLNFYPPVGPLLGVYGLSILFFLVFLGIFSVSKIKSQSFAYWFFVISTIFFVIFVFPPVFEPIAHLLGE